MVLPKMRLDLDVNVVLVVRDADQQRACDKAKYEALGYWRIFETRREHSGNGAVGKKAVVCYIRIMSVQ
jgi:hypothetical protein